MRPSYSTAFRNSFRVPRNLSRRRSFSTGPLLSLWNGATQPYKNQSENALPPSAAQQHQAEALSSRTATIPAAEEAEKIRRIHTKFIEDLLSRAASSSQGLDATNHNQNPSKTRKGTRQHSLSEPPLFRTDGPLTPYPIELDTGEKLEPKHATLVRVMDKSGQQRSIVVAEVDDDSGKQRSILLALDLDVKDGVGRKITAEEMYATLGLETQDVKP